MPKTEGWTKDKNFDIWINDDNANILVYIEKTPYNWQGYVVKISDHGRIGVIMYTETLQEARTKVVDFLRKL